MLIKLAIKSLNDRKIAILLSLMAMTVSIFVLLGVEHIRHQTKESFSNTVSGTDLIVGARTGSLNLLLYSVFKMGSPTNNLSWQSFENIADNPMVKWAVPLSLGDSHKGFRVLGTTPDYFQHFSYGKQHRLAFAEGKAFNQLFDVVLGAQVAKNLDYQLGDNIVLAHGVAKKNFSLHSDMPFSVVGILAPTGTPVDQSLHVSLAGIEAIHLDWQGGNAISAHEHGHEHEYEQTEGLVENALSARLKPESITAIMLGLESKINTFKLQREINQYPKEALLAILPGVALSELWQMMSILENTLLLVSVLVFISACLGVNAMLISSIRERAREIQLLRIIGASPLFLFFLIELEALIITAISIAAGSSLLIISLLLAQNYLIAHFGLHISMNIFSPNNLYLMGVMLSASILVAMVPSFIGYMRSINKKSMY